MTLRPRPIVAIVVAAALAGGCVKRQVVSSGVAGSPSAARSGEPPKVEVKVLADGSVLLDERPTTLARLDRRLGELAKSNGVVWYYRESPRAAPPPAAIDVINLVIKYRLPLTMSTRPDFGDSIDDQGNVRTRR